MVFHVFVHVIFTQVDIRSPEVPKPHFFNKLAPDERLRRLISKYTRYRNLLGAKGQHVKVT